MSRSATRRYMIISIVCLTVSGIEALTGLLLSLRGDGGAWVFYLLALSFLGAGVGASFSISPPKQFDKHHSNG